MFPLDLQTSLENLSHFGLTIGISRTLLSNLDHTKIKSVNLNYCVGVSEVFKDSAFDEAEAERLIHASPSDDPFKNKNNLAKTIPDQNSPKTEVPKKEETTKS